MSTGYFADLSEAGVSSFNSLPQSMRVPSISSPAGLPVAQAMQQQRGSNSKLGKIEHPGFPAPSGFAGPRAPQRY